MSANFLPEPWLKGGCSDTMPLPFSKGDRYVSRRIPRGRFHSTILMLSILDPSSAHSWSVVSQLVSPNFS